MVACAQVSNKPSKLSLNVKGEGYVIHELLQLEGADGHATPLAHGAQVVNPVDFGQVGRQGGSAGWLDDAQQHVRVWVLLPGSMPLPSLKIRQKLPKPSTNACIGSGVAAQALQLPCPLRGTACSGTRLHNTPAPRCWLLAPTTTQLV